MEELVLRSLRSWLLADLLAVITCDMMFCLLDCEAGQEKMACGRLPLRFWVYSARIGRLWVAAAVASGQIQDSCVLGS